MRSILTSSKYGQFGDWYPKRWDRLKNSSPISFLRFSSNITPRIFLVTSGSSACLSILYGTEAPAYNSENAGETSALGSRNGQENRARRAFPQSRLHRLLESDVRRPAGGETRAGA